MARGGARPGSGRPAKGSPPREPKVYVPVPKPDPVPDAPRIERPDPAGNPVEMAEGLARRMLAELDATTLLLEEITSFVLIETLGDLTGKRRELMLRAISLPTRAATLKTLTAALKDTKPVAVGGKKEQQAAAAAEVARGRFSPAAPPRLVSVNGS